MQVAVWLPLYLWLADRTFFEAEEKNWKWQRRIFYPCWVAILSGVVLLAGNAQMAFYEGLLLAFYLTGWILSEREKRGRRVAVASQLFGAWIAGSILIAAIVWMPALKFSEFTVRGSVSKAFYYLGTWLTPSRLASAFYYPAFGLQTEMVGWAESAIYVGLFPSVLVLVRIMKIKTNWKTDAPIVVMGATALSLAFGMNNPINHLLIKLPLFSLFRYQGRMALGVLAALGALLAHMLSATEKATGEERDEHLITRIRWAGLLIGISLVFFVALAHKSRAISAGGIVLIGDTILTWWGIASLRERKQTKRLEVWVFVYIVFHLLLMFPAGRLATMKPSRFQEALSFFNRVVRSDGVPPRLLVIDVGRFADRDLLSFNKFGPQEFLPNLCAGNTGVFAGVQTMDPYTPLMPLTWARIIREEIGKNFTNVDGLGKLDQGTANLLRVLGVDYVVTSGRVIEIPGYDRVEVDLSLAFGPEARMYTIQKEPPRMWMVDVASPLKTNLTQNGLEEVIEILKDGKFDAVWCLVPEGFSIGSFRECELVGGQRDEKAVKVRRFQLGRNEATIEFSTFKEGWAVIEISYDPEWEAYLDGEPCKVLPVNLVYCIVEIPEKGEHTLEFRYRPRMVLQGAIVSCAGSFAILALMLAFLLRKREEK